jgi:hypothetical protein
MDFLDFFNENISRKAKVGQNGGKNIGHFT